MVELLRGRVVKRQEHRSGAFWRYHVHAPGTVNTDVVFMAEDEIPIGARVEFNEDMVQAVDVDCYQRVYAISRVMQRDARAPQGEMRWDWPEVQAKPQQRIQSWAKREAQRLGMTLRFEQDDESIWTIVVDTPRGEIRHVLMPGTPWADALEAVGLEP